MLYCCQQGLVDDRGLCRAPCALCLCNLPSYQKSTCRAVLHAAPRTAAGCVGSVAVFVISLNWARNHDDNRCWGTFYTSESSMFSSIFILCPDIVHWEKVRRNLLCLQQASLGDVQVIYSIFWWGRKQWSSFSLCSVTCVQDFCLAHFQRCDASGGLPKGSLQGMVFLS